MLHSYNIVVESPSCGLDLMNVNIHPKVSDEDEANKNRRIQSNSIFVVAVSL